MGLWHSVQRGSGSQEGFLGVTALFNPNGKKEKGKLADWHQKLGAVRVAKFFSLWCAMLKPWFHKRLASFHCLTVGVGSKMRGNRHVGETVPGLLNAVRLTACWWPLSGGRASTCAWSTPTVSASTGKAATTTRTPARTACSTWATCCPPSCSSASTGPRRRTASGGTEEPRPALPSSHTNDDFYNAFDYTHLSESRINMRAVNCWLLNFVES